MQNLCRSVQIFSLSIPTKFRIVFDRTLVIIDVDAIDKHGGTPIIDSFCIEPI